MKKKQYLKQPIYYLRETRIEDSGTIALAVFKDKTESKFLMELTSYLDAMSIVTDVLIESGFINELDFIEVRSMGGE